MTNKQQPDPSTQKLIDSLAEQDDARVGVTLLTGRALSRSTKNVHMAIAGGIVAVPIGNIARVFPLRGAQPDAVRMEVRNPQEIQPLLKVKRIRTGTGATGTTGGPIESARDGEIVYTDRTYRVYEGVNTVTYTDTDTISGGQGQADQCDDSEPGEGHPDDTNE